MIQNERALFRAKKEPGAATPMEPQPIRELERLHRIFSRISGAIGSSAEGINDIDALYLFDEEEAERLNIDGQCCRFKDGTVAIGLYVGIMDKPEYATLVFIHEIAHLKYWKHNKAYHDYLDELIEEYNKRTGSAIENDYVGLDEGSRKDSKDYMH